MIWSTWSRDFAVVNRMTSHLAVHPADKALCPPQSYLFVQDALIIASGTLWVLAYIFYTLKCIRDRRAGIPIHVLCFCPAWELFYGIVIPSTPFERVAFLAWFFTDLQFIVIAINVGHKSNRITTAKRMLLLIVAQVALYWALSILFPDDQATAYFTGFSVQLLVTWGSTYDLVKTKSTRGQSIEIWCMRFLGTFFAFCTFLWRYVNVPGNWAYVGSIWSIFLISVWLVSDLLYPLVYYRVKKGKLKEV